MVYWLWPSQGFYSKQRLVSGEGMGWWRKLKVWVIAGIIFGIVYFVIFMTLLNIGSQGMGESGAGFLLFFILWPGAWLFWLINFTPVDYGGLMIIGIFCAIFNASAISFLGWIVTSIRARANYR
jgi:hypothetical protein